MAQKTVAIIGSGIVGAAIAHTLTKKGHRVRIFEKGPEYPYPHVDQFERVVLHQASIAKYELKRDLKDHTVEGDYSRDIEIERFMNTGGSATRWEGITLRMHPEDFRTRTLFDYGLDWPIGYDDLEPYYCLAESFLGVSGTDEDNPFAPPRSKPFPLPPFELGYDDLVFRDKLKAKGVALHSTPQARTRQDYESRPGCKNYGACRYCPIGARYSPVYHIQQAVESGLCDIENNVSVRRIDVEGDRTKHIVYRGNGAKGDQEFPADYFVLGAGAIESARVLLLSQTKDSPSGVGNAGGQVGRNFAFHHMWFGNIRYNKPVHSGGFGGWTGQCHQFLNPETRGKHGGVKVEFSSRPPKFEREANEWKSAKDLHQRLQQRMRDRTINLHAETQIAPNKYIGLSEKKDRFGDPFAHVRYESSEFDSETHNFARTIFDQFVEGTQGDSVGFSEVNDFNSGSHHMGTCRMGKSPADSVVDEHCRVHGVSNLYVIGASNFTGSSGAMNPTLTVTALSLRAADHLLEQLGPA